MGKISRALGSTARAGEERVSEANTATGPPKPRAPPRWPSGEVGVQPEVPGAPSCRTAGPSALLGICEQCHCRAPQTLLGGTEAVEERGAPISKRIRKKGLAAMPAGETSAALQTRSGATPMVLMAMAAP